MTGPLDLRLEADGVTRPPLDSVQNGCGHGGADSLRSGKRHRCVEKTRQHEAASIRRQPRPRGTEKAEVRGGSRPVSGEALLNGAGNVPPLR